MSDEICKRCGQCCFLQSADKKPTNIKCKYLVWMGAGIISCRIYGNRLGKRLNDINICGPRAALKINFKDCPYNKPGQIEHEIDVKNRKVIK